MSQGHSPLGFSGAELYLNCVGGPALAAALPLDAIEPDQEYTVQGQAAHAVAAKCLTDGLDAWEFGGWTHEGYELDEEDMAAVQFYLDTVRPLDLEAQVEVKLAAPEIHELAWGTIDLLEIDGNTATVTDYKHGAGVFVPIEWNSQLMGYAGLVAYRYPQVERFRLRIVQPRIPGENQVREWEIHRVPLMHWIETVLKPGMITAGDLIAGDIAKITQHLVTGDHCRFCKVQRALACPAHNQALAVVEQAAPLVERMSTARLGELCGKVPTLELMIASIKREAASRMLDQGEQVDNMKVVTKIAHRAWKDSAQESLVAALGEDVLETKLRSPAEVEKLSKVAKQLTKEYAFTPDIGLTVAPLSDRRHAVTGPVGGLSEFAKFVDKQELLE